MIISRGFGEGGNTLLARGFGLAVSIVAGFMGWEEKKHRRQQKLEPIDSLQLDSYVTVAMCLKSPVELGKLVLKSLVTPNVTLRSLVADKLKLASPVSRSARLESKL